MNELKEKDLSFDALFQKLHYPVMVISLLFIKGTIISSDYCYSTKSKYYDDLQENENAYRSLFRHCFGKELYNGNGYYYLTDIVEKNDMDISQYVKYVRIYNFLIDVFGDFREGQYKSVSDMFDKIDSDSELEKKLMTLPRMRQGKISLSLRDRCLELIMSLDRFGLVDISKNDDTFYITNGIRYFQHLVDGLKFRNLED